MHELEFLSNGRVVTIRELGDTLVIETRKKGSDLSYPSLAYIIDGDDTEVRVWTGKEEACGEDPSTTTGVLPPYSEADDENLCQYTGHEKDECWHCQPD
jgi:hypothetical protein